MTLCHGPVIIRTIFQPAPHITRGGFLTRLLKAEIVFPNYGILINTGVGNPTAPSITALGDKKVLPGWWGHVVASTYIRG